MEEYIALWKAHATRWRGGAQQCLRQPTRLDNIQNSLLVRRQAGNLANDVTNVLDALVQRLRRIERSVVDCVAVKWVAPLKID